MECRFGISTLTMLGVTAGASSEPMVSVFRLSILSPHAMKSSLNSLPPKQASGGYCGFRMMKV